MYARPNEFNLSPRSVTGQLTTSNSNTRKYFHWPEVAKVYEDLRDLCPEDSASSGHEHTAPYNIKSSYNIHWKIYLPAMWSFGLRVNETWRKITNERRIKCESSNPERCPVIQHRTHTRRLVRWCCSDQHRGAPGKLQPPRVTGGTRTHLSTFKLMHRWTMSWFLKPSDNIWVNAPSK